MVRSELNIAAVLALLVPLLQWHLQPPPATCHLVVTKVRWRASELLTFRPWCCLRLFGLERLFTENAFFLKFVQLMVTQMQFSALASSWCDHWPYAAVDRHGHRKLCHTYCSVASASGSDIT